MFQAVTDISLISLEEFRKKFEEILNGSPILCGIFSRILSESDKNQIIESAKNHADELFKKGFIKCHPTINLCLVFDFGIYLGSLNDLKELFQRFGINSTSFTMHLCDGELKTNNFLIVDVFEGLLLNAIFVHLDKQGNAGSEFFSEYNKYLSK